MSLDWSFPYSSQRAPVFARNAVATSQPLAAQAGLDALKRGGNAVDAALATAITLTVVEPCSNGLGSDAFAIVWDGSELHGINGSGRSPASWNADTFAEKKSITNGWDSITVPGAVDAWVTLSERFGSLPFGDLFESAISYASEGFSLGPVVNKSWVEAVDSYAEYPCFRDAFLPGGQVPNVGDVFRFPDQAITLQRIAETKGQDFYEGELARTVVDYLAQHGSEFTLQDFSNHRTDWVTPISKDFANVSLKEIPPNGQGIAALIALGILEQLGLDEYSLDSADSIHLQIEATKIGLHLALTHVADPDFMRISVEELLDESFLAGYVGRIKRESAIDVERLPSNGGTVMMTTADQSGMMVSLIQSNYWGFGSGIVVPGTGISLQNRGAGFSLDRDHPNAVGGSKRPFHTIIPGFVMRDNSPLMSFGVMGTHMQTQGHVQMMSRIFAYGQNPQAASDAPRWYIQPDGEMVFESGFDQAVVNELVNNRGHRLSMDPQLNFGGAQLIYRLDNGFYCAASDHRKDGQAVGY